MFVCLSFRKNHASNAFLYSGPLYSGPMRINVVHSRRAQDGSLFRQQCHEIQDMLWNTKGPRNMFHATMGGLACDQQNVKGFRRTLFLQYNLEIFYSFGFATKLGVIWYCTVRIQYKVAEKVRVIL